MSTPKEKFMDFFIPSKERTESSSSGSAGAKPQIILKVERLQERFHDAVNAHERKAKVQKGLEDLLKTLDEVELPKHKNS